MAWQTVGGDFRLTGTLTNMINMPNLQSVAGSMELVENGNLAQSKTISAVWLSLVVIPFFAVLRLPTLFCYYHAYR